MNNLRGLFQSALRELPKPASARWASACLTLSALTVLISLTASQALLAASGICYTVHLLRDRPRVFFPPIKLPLAVFCLGTIFSTLGAANPQAGLFAVRKMVLFLILLLVTNLIASRKLLEFLFRGLFVQSLLAALVGVVQFVRQYEVERTLHPDRLYVAMTVERITGFMGHWMNFSGQQMLVFASLLAFLLLNAAAGGPGKVQEEKGSGSRSRILWWLVLGAVALSIVLGFTRGVWLGCGGATLYLIARWKPRLLWAVPAILVVGYLFAPSMVRQRVAAMAHPRSDPSLSIRFEMWGVGAAMIRQHPWQGVGPNNIEQQYVLYLPPGKTPEPGYHAHLHSNFFQLGAERGLPVLAAWAWMMAALAWSIARRGRRLGQFCWVADAALAAWIAFVVEGFFEFNFGMSPVLMLFLYLMAVPFAAERIEASGAMES